MPLLYLLFFIQIVSESFPISSSGHVALLECFDKCTSIMSDPVMHMLHIPTVLIIAFFFRHQWWPVIKSIQRTWPIVLSMVSFTLVADCITCVFYLLKKQYHIPLPLYGGFFITALILYSLRFVDQDRRNKVSFKTMVILGFVQGVSLLPGISRFASVYVAARWLGVAPHKAFSITWMIQWPLITAAALVSLCHAEVIHLMMSGEVLLIMGAASIVALGGMYLVYMMALGEKLWWFSIYMMLPIFVSWWICV